MSFSKDELSRAINDLLATNPWDNQPPPETGVRYEVYRERFLITEWRDGAIWKTRSLGCDWFLEEVTHGNPRDTGYLYVAATDEFAKNNITIRRR